MLTVSELILGRVVNEVTPSSGVAAINCNLGSFFRINLTSNVASLTFSNVPSTGAVVVDLLVVQDATGGRTFAWPSSITWESGAAPVVKTAANAKTSVKLTTIDGGTSWLGTYAVTPGGGGGAAITVKDEGSVLTAALASLNFVGNAISATNTGGDVVITSSYDKGIATPTISSGTLTLDLAAYRVFNVAMTANITTLAFSNVPSSGSVIVDLVLVQDSTGSRTLSWPSSVKFLNGTPPLLGSLPADVAYFRLMTNDGGSTWVCLDQVPSTIFSPYSLKNIFPGYLHYWFDFTTKAYLYQDTACTTPVTATGQSIAAVKDRLNSGMVLTQATSSKRPVYQESGGIGYAAFTTSAQSALTTTSAPLSLSTNDFTVCVASRFENSGSMADDNCGIWTFASAGPNTNFEAFLRVYGLRKYYGYYQHGGSSSAGEMSFTASQDNKKTVVATSRAGSNVSYKGISEDTQTTTGTGTQSWSSRTSSTFGIGYYDPTYTASPGFNGRIFSVVGSAVAYAQTDTDKLLAYLKALTGF